MRNQKTHIPRLKYKDVKVELSSLTWDTNSGVNYSNVDQNVVFGRTDILFMTIIYWTNSLVWLSMDSNGRCSFLSLAKPNTGSVTARGFYLE